MSQFRCCFIILMAFAFAGCGRRSVSVNTDTTSTVSTSDDVLNSALDQLHPEKFGITTSPEKPVSLLNTWRAKLAENEKIPDETVPVNVPAGWLSADEETRIAQTKFDFGDAVHIRDALFHRSVANYLSDRGHNELQRVISVVDFVCRNVSLWKDDEVELPLMPFISMQVGRGSTDDRAWICGAILRQLRIDSIILRAKSDTKETTEKWLLAVAIDRQFYLFDLRLGLPIPNGDGDSVATLSEIASHPEWLNQLAVNEPYRLTIDEIRAANVFVMSGPGFWCHRMRKLEEVLPAKNHCILYSPLLGDDSQPGLLNRISAIGGWPLDNLQYWRYPQRQVDASMHLTESAAIELERLQAPFSVPIPVKEDEKKQMVPGIPEKKLQRYRTDQLLGKFSEATQEYLSIRHLEVEPYPPAWERVNRWAAEDAFYWTSVCKFEMGEYEPAIEQLNAYLKKYDRKGKWYFPARTLLAQCYAELGNVPQAIATVERNSSDDPYRISNAIRVKRWNAAKAK